jgi:hypothetical protein
MHAPFFKFRYFDLIRTPLDVSTHFMLKLLELVQLPPLTASTCRPLFEPSMRSNLISKQWIYLDTIYLMVCFTYYEMLHNRCNFLFTFCILSNVDKMLLLSIAFQNNKKLTTLELFGLKMVTLSGWKAFVRPILLIFVVGSVFIRATLLNWCRQRKFPIN